MGDRANVVVKTGDEQVVLYTHWGGFELPSILRDALKRAPDRWHDHAYLTRIIFCDMIGNDTKSTTGFGISQTKQDQDGDQCLLVDTEKQTVSFEAGGTFSFEEYSQFESPCW